MKMREAVYTYPLRDINLYSIRYKCWPCGKLDEYWYLAANRSTLTTALREADRRLSTYPFNTYERRWSVLDALVESNQDVSEKQEQSDAKQQKGSALS
jgi:hypothetical protein